MDNQEIEPASRIASDKPMTLEDLARRWEITEEEVKVLVRKLGVPHFLVTPADDRINWKRIRFNLDAIREWEVGSEKRFKPRKDETLSPAPKTTRLGNWRKSSTVG